jgi:membrane fusion protein, multidrug efflux system
MDERVERTDLDREAPPLSRPSRVRRSSLRWLLLAPVIAAIALGLWLVASHRPAQRRGRASFATAQPVGAATIGTGNVRITLDELGTVTPLDTVTVLTQISGQLVRVAFQEGQLVKKGQLLVQIDDRPYQAQLEHDEGVLAHDQGLLAQARADLQRFVMEARTNSIAQQQLEDQRYLVQQDEGTVKEDQGTVATDELNIAYCHIVSPIDGRVGLRLVDQGNYVQTTSATGIAVLTQLQPMSVVFSVPQQDVAEVEEQMAQGVTLPVDAYDQSNTTRIDEGKLTAIDTEMNTSTGTVNMRATFPNPKNELFPNEFVNAHLLVDTLSNVVRVPVPAVQVGTPGTYVWFIDRNDTVTARPVKLGPVDGQFQQVISGLQPGDRVVTDGTDRLRDGMKVTIPAASPSGPVPGTPGGGHHHGNGRHAARPAPASTGAPPQ